jgi:D-alanyl-D-alanine carboxypeptidase/D-alanyl-D-alanine-endopeptidase (penicillin-binding protein 4)
MSIERQSRQPRLSRLAASLLAVAACAAVGTLSGNTAGAAQAVRPSPSPAATAVRNLQREIDAVLAAPILQTGIWGVEIKSLQRDETLFSANAAKLLVPSSDLKILTLAAAADRLGWDYSYETRVEAYGTIDAAAPAGTGAGVLNGDLVMVGTGDPSIENWAGDATRLFQQWADEIKAAGIHTVTGRLVGDDKAFDDNGLGTGWAWDDLDRSYATSVGALQFNENTAQISVAPGETVDADAFVTPSPPSAGLIIRNQVKTAARGTPANIAITRLPASATLLVRGTFALGARPSVHNVSVVNPTQYFVNELRAALVANGIDIKGPAVDIDDVADPPSRLRGTPAVLVRHHSPPLSELATTMMRLSQNLYAETLLRTLGRSSGVPSAVGGVAAVRAELDKWNVPANGYTQVDGSGLSRYNYVTPATFVAVLEHVYRDPRLRDPFRATLPIAGRAGTGTLENRMKGTAAEGNVRAKTGSLTGAHSLSGYVTSADGEPLVFSIIANNSGASSEVIERAIDAIAVRLAGFSRR